MMLLAYERVMSRLNHALRSVLINLRTDMDIKLGRNRHAAVVTDVMSVEVL